MEQVKQKPWLIRTYAGHSSAKASNELYRKNLNFIIIDRTFELKEFGIFFTAFCLLVVA